MTIEMKYCQGKNLKDSKCNVSKNSELKLLIYAIPSSS